MTDMTIEQAREILSAKLLQSLLVNLPTAMRAIGVLLAATDPAKCGWQPIETAPKDGRRILAFDPYIGLVVCSAGHRNTAPNITYWECINAILVEPTLWMPLPAAPKQGDKS